eukprot:176615-Rhodomonas_salina.3
MLPGSVGRPGTMSGRAPRTERPRSAQPAVEQRCRRWRLGDEGVEVAGDLLHDVGERGHEDGVALRLKLLAREVAEADADREHPDAPPVHGLETRHRHHLQIRHRQEQHLRLCRILRQHRNVGAFVDLHPAPTQHAISPHTIANSASDITQSTRCRDSIPNSELHLPEADL